MKTEKMTPAIEAGLIIDDMEQFVGEIGGDFYCEEGNTVNIDFLYGKHIYKEYGTKVVDELRKQYSERKSTYDKKGMN